MHPKNRHIAALAPAGRRIPRPPAASRPPAREPPWRRTWSFWIVFFMFVALISLFIPSDLSLPQIKDYSAPNPANRALKLVCMVLSVIFIARRLRLANAMVKSVNAYFTAFLILIPVSAIWSIDPGATIARFVSLLTVVLVCFAVCLVDWHRLRFQQIVRPILTLYLVGSLVVGLIWPDLVLEQGDDISLKDAWHGLSSQKNEFGQVGSFGMILWLHAWLSRDSKFIPAACGFAVATACMLLSRSSTALLATSFALPLLLLLQRQPPWLRPYMPYLIGVFTGLVLTYAIAVLNIVPGMGILLKPFVMMTGKDFTFSNRVIIWQIIKEHIQLAPLLGTGYGAYWVGPVPTSPSFVFLSRMWVYPTQSHNGFLEVVNDLGFVGLFVLLGYLIGFVKQSLKLLTFDRTQGALFIAIIFQQIIINLSEAVWITAKSLSSNLMILATIALGRALLEQRRKTRLAQGMGAKR